MIADPADQHELDPAANHQRFVGRIALVTGGLSGIGRAAAERLHEEGATVVVADLRATASAEQAVQSFGSEVQMDVADGGSVAAGIDEVIRRHGGLDIVVNAAGVLGFGAAHELDEDEWDHCLDVNLKGSFLVCRAAWPHLVTRGGGAIVNLGSILGCTPLPADVPYCVAKAGVHMLTRCLALDGAEDSIRVNAIAPGYVDTPMTQRAMELEPDPGVARRDAVRQHPLGRLGTPADIAGAIAFVASDEAIWITGTTIPVDGGYLTGRCVV